MINKGAQVVWNTTVGFVFLAVLGAVVATNAIVRKR